MNKKLSVFQRGVNQEPIRRKTWGLLKLVDNNEHQCLAYSSIVPAAILKFCHPKQQLRAAQICSIRLHWFFIKFIWGSSSVSDTISNVIKNFD